VSFKRGVCVRHFSFRPPITLRGRTNKGLRGLAGKPLHPPLTDVPIAAYLFTATFDVISIILHGSHPAVGRQLFLAGSWTLLGGVAVSVLTAITGAVDWSKSSQPGTQARRTINAHAVTMIVVTVIVLVNLLVRLTAFHDRVGSPAAVVTLSVVGAALVVFGATLGGSLVFDYGFNVETAGDHPVWHESEVDVFPSDEH
jgi:uncharacterized membrane protein